MKGNFHKTILLTALVGLLYGCSDSGDDSEDETTITSKVFSKACMAGAQPIISVADFNADGIVDQADVEEIGTVIQDGIYYTLYDRNVDGVVDQLDQDLTTRSIGVSSTDLDKSIVTLFHEVEELQTANGLDDLANLGFQKGTSSLAGHGEHWLNDIGNAAISGQAQSQFLRAEGINVSKADNKVWALFWGQNGDLQFTNGATDFPVAGGEWMDSQVNSFSGEPPVFDNVDASKWHTHAGLCITTKGSDIVLSQHTTFNQCQAMEDDSRGAGEFSTWINIWMIHAWLFVPNPNGLFANTHPCIDQDSPAESLINGDRNVPAFFHHAH